MTTLKLALPTSRQASVAVPALIGFAARQMFSGVWCWCADRLAPARTAESGRVPTPTVAAVLPPSALHVQASSVSLRAAASREAQPSRALTLR